jgi:tetratricopeptide (TPR) repeat protein
MARGNETEAVGPAGGLRHPWRDLAAAAVALVGCVALGLWLLRPDPLPADLPRDQYQLGERRYRELYGRAPGQCDVYSLLGEMAVSSGQLPRALTCFAAIPSSNAQYGPSARFQQAQVLERLHRAVEAEQCFREFVALAEADPGPAGERLTMAYQWLVFMLSVQIRLEDRKPLLAKMHESQRAGVWESKLYFFPHLLILNSADGSGRLALYREQDEQNVALNVAHGRYLTMQGDLDRALPFLEALHRQHADDIRCAAALLELNFERDDWARIAAVAAALPADAPQEPWLLTRMRGELALHDERWEDAVRQFTRLLEHDPTNPWCHTGLARAYEKLGRSQDRDEMLRRSLVLSRIRVDLFNVTEEDAGANRALATACEEIGLAAAANVFRAHAVRIQRQTAARSAVQVQP